MQLGHGVECFVAHVREAEGLALDLAVPAIDEDLVFVLERLLQLGDIDVLVVLYAGKREGFITAFGKSSNPRDFAHSRVFSAILACRA